MRKGEMRNPKGLSFRKVLDGASPCRKVFAALAAALGSRRGCGARGRRSGTDTGGRYTREQAKRKPADLVADGHGEERCAVTH